MRRSTQPPDRSEQSPLTSIAGRRPAINIVKIKPAHADLRQAHKQSNSTRGSGVAGKPAPQAGSRPLRAVAPLELLPTPAPARIVAPDLVLVIDHALLDHGTSSCSTAPPFSAYAPTDGLRRPTGAPRPRRQRRAPRRRRRCCPPEYETRPARVALPAAAKAGCGARTVAAAVLALDVDLDVEDHARVVRPDAVHAGRRTARRLRSCMPRAGRSGRSRAGGCPRAGSPCRTGARASARR